MDRPITVIISCHFEPYSDLMRFKTDYSDNSWSMQSTQSPATDFSKAWKTGHGNMQP